ncbi:Signal peptidase I [Kitasatospora sp. MMS16-BH015]|uniref:signal peptidase I n=1 Tax=Kitasatospora sp. MMS16-BH015 TaxID=2018025 RepID=UPI000CA1E310|nr:signal peptidase I [Kitasatospora sp. MMS16-BH015]AUG80913.1 Signal peptidase I [Kitasatospora sp. MMS16-BH015]
MSWWRAWRGVAIGVGILLGLGVAAVAVLAVIAVRVDGHSMQPTLADGERLLPDKISQGSRLHRFDVVLLKTPGRDTTIVKRVIGLPGDRVEIDSTPAAPFTVLVQPGGTGQWYRIDQPTWPAQAHRSSNCCQPDGQRDAAPHPQTVPPGKLFFLGDNPDGSDDARTFGWGDLTTVSARIHLRVWPLTAFGSLPAGPAMTPVPAPQS